jgi:hypothetical protein
MTVRSSQRMATHAALMSSVSALGLILILTHDDAARAFLVAASVLLALSAILVPVLIYSSKHWQATIAESPSAPHPEPRWRTVQRALPQTGVLAALVIAACFTPVELLGAAVGLVSSLAVLNLLSLYVVRRWERRSGLRLMEPTSPIFSRQSRVPFAVPGNDSRGV